MRKFFARLRAFFRREKLDRDMAEEMRFHLSQRTADHVADGMSPDEARYAARRKFGGVEQIKEGCREQRGFVWAEQFAQDIRYAGRQLRRNPGFAATAVAILALAIGATTAIFSVVHAIVLKPLPYEQPGQLLQLFEADQPGAQNAVSVGVFLDWREQATRFESLASYRNIRFNLSGSGEPERIAGLRMSANGLHLLRAHPVVGRLFAPDEDQAGREKVIVLTHELWQRRFGGDSRVFGRSVNLNDEPYTVVGVLPAGFLPFEAHEFVVPLVFDPKSREQRDSHVLRVLARLKPGVTLEQARAEIETIVRRNKSIYPAWKREWTATVSPLQDHLVQEIKPALVVLLAAVGLVLLIACANVANLLLVKASARQKEIAVRGALGATRGRIVRQLIAESVFLSASGAGLGLLVAVWSVSWLRHVVGAMGLVRAHEITLDLGVLGFAMVVSLGTSVVFGSAPAWQASRPRLDDALKEAARGTAKSGNRLRGTLIVGEVALALMLLVGAGLLLQSFSRVTNVPVGFNPDRALTLQLSLSDQKYPDNARRVAFYQRVAEGVAALPGVETAGLSLAMPLSGSAPERFFRIDGRTDHREPGYRSFYDFCTADYFRALGIPLQRGRVFDAREVGADARVAVINEALAREFFPGEDPIGRRIGVRNEWWEIVGIVGDVRVRSLTRPAPPMLYRPQAADDAWRSAHLFVRTRGSALGVVESVRRSIHEIDPAQPVADVQTLAQVVAASVSDRRLTLMLLAGFAGVALILAAIGLYGVVAYAVTQRTREFGIRIALGASSRDVHGMVIGEGMKLAIIGLALGVSGALGVTHLLTRLLYEIEPTDAVTFGGVSLLLLLVALLASWLPARRAAKVDPMVALRCE